MNITFSGSYLTETVNLKRTGTMATGGGSGKAAKTVCSSNYRQSRTSTNGLKGEPEEFVVNVFDFAQADNLMFNEPTKEACEVLKEYMQLYCSEYTAAFEKAVNQEYTAEDITESVYLVIPDPR